MSFCAYILRCADGTLYTGYTRDLQKRVATHNAGRGAAYTRWRLPVALVHAEAFATQGEAMRREIELKTWSRARKIELIEETRRSGGPGVTAASAGPPAAR